MKLSEPYVAERERRVDAPNPRPEDVQRSADEQQVAHYFTHHAPSDEQVAAMSEVSFYLMNAARAMVRLAPPSADRTTAIRKLREARMDFNAGLVLGEKIPGARV